MPESGQNPQTEFFFWRCAASCLCCAITLGQQTYILFVLGSEHRTRHPTYLPFGHNIDHGKLCWLIAQSHMAPVARNSSMLRTTPALLVSLTSTACLTAARPGVRQLTDCRNRNPLPLEHHIRQVSLNFKLEIKITAHIPVKQPLLWHATLMQDVKYGFASPLRKLWIASRAIIVSRDSR